VPTPLTTTSTAKRRRIMDDGDVVIVNAPRGAQLTRIRQRAYSVREIAKDVVKKERQMKNTTGLPDEDEAMLMQQQQHGQGHRKRGTKQNTLPKKTAFQFW
jgi:hypothetical protein